MEKSKADRPSISRFLDIFEGKVEESSTFTDIAKHESKPADKIYDFHNGNIPRRKSSSWEEEIMEEKLLFENADFRSRAFTNPETTRPVHVRKKAIVHSRDEIDIIVKSNSRQVCLIEENGDEEIDLLSPGSSFRTRAFTNPEMRRPNLVRKKPIIQNKDKIDIFVQKHTRQPCMKNENKKEKDNLSSNYVGHGSRNNHNSDMRKLFVGQKKPLIQIRDEFRVVADNIQEMRTLEDIEAHEDEMRPKNYGFRSRASTDPERGKYAVEDRKQYFQSKEYINFDKYAEGNRIFVREANADAKLHKNTGFRSRAATNPEMNRPGITRKQPIIQRRDHICVVEMLKDINKGKEKRIVTAIPDLILPKRNMRNIYRADNFRPRAHTFDVIPEKRTGERGTLKTGRNDTMMSTYTGFRSRAGTNPEMRGTLMKNTKLQDQKSDRNLQRGQDKGGQPGKQKLQPQSKALIPFIQCTKPLPEM